MFVVSLTKSHTGIYLAETLAATLKEFGIDMQSLGMAMDNASNNDTLLANLPKIMPSTATVGVHFQIRCFGHIVNLSCKAFLSLFVISKKHLTASSHRREALTAEDDGWEDVDDEEDDEDDLDAGEQDDRIPDEDAEREAGDVDEIEELSAKIALVTNLTEYEHQEGRTTLHKVYFVSPHCISLLIILFSFVLLAKSSATTISTRRSWLTSVGLNKLL